MRFVTSVKFYKKFTDFCVRITDFWFFVVFLSIADLSVNLDFGLEFIGIFDFTNLKKPLKFREFFCDFL